MEEKRGKKRGEREARQERQEATVIKALEGGVQESEIQFNKREKIPIFTLLRARVPMRR
jgi:hypothetical protein